MGTPTGRVLVPIAELERRALHEAVNVNIVRLFSELGNKDLPVRYDPPPHTPRKQPEPRFFSKDCGPTGKHVRFKDPMYRWVNGRLVSA
ncbi:MAG TPA: hypothetical protein VIY48_04120 [Candidatus Paceibacterota bacterium]